MASEMPVNEHCLFPTLDAAIAGAVRFAAEQPEPGDYYVVEVLEGGRESSRACRRTPNAPAPDRCPPPEPAR
jgi:hypothetical protein